MLIQRSRLAAAGAERPRLVAPWVLALLTAATLLALVAIFPFRSLVQQVVSSTRGDPLTTSYLRNLLRTDPQNPELRLMLARQQFAEGHHDQALRTLEPTLRAADLELRRDAAWLAWRIRTRQADAYDEARRRRALIEDLRQVAQEDWPDDVLVEMARHALALGQTELAVELYQRAAAITGEHGVKWYADAAAAALGQGEYRVAARLHLVARARSRNLEERRSHFLAALQALRSGDMVAEAVELGDGELGDLAQDRQTLLKMVELARAANRGDLAEKYARALLRLSLLQRWRRLDLARQGFDGGFLRVAETQPGGPQVAFDERVYGLGYEVFLANRKLEDAYRVAASAVRQVPGSLVWRKRLAQVAEWTARPREALEHWLFLARRGGGEEAWQAVLRLAPGLRDDRALLAAYEHRLAQGSRDPRLVTDAAATYERLGDPQAGLDLLARLYRERPDPRLLEAMAELAERSGDPARAADYWRQVIEAQGVTRERAQRLAGLLLGLGRLDEALAWLDRAAAQAPDEDGVFWRGYADLARRLQEDDKAIAAYRRVLGTREATEEDYAALIELLAGTYPLQAAALAQDAWARWGSQASLMRAFGLLAAAGRWHEAQRLLARMDTTQLAAAERDIDFLRLRADLSRHLGDPARARRDLELALRLQPDDAELRAALLWLLIDGNDPVALRAALTRWESDWRRDPALHDALAAAWQALSEPRAALAYLTPRLKAKRGDFLWLMNYADALEQNGDGDRAWRLRQYLWQNLRRGTAALGEREMEQARRAARARLLLSQREGDPAFAAIRELLRADRAAGALSPEAKELALSWLQDAGEFEAERGFLWQQYGRNLSRPLWAEITAALQVDDRADIAALVERHGERLPRHDYVAAAQRSDDLLLAQSAAFDKQERQPDDDTLHRQLTESVLAHADSLAFEFARRRVGVLDETARTLQAEVGLSPHLRLALTLGSTGRASRDHDQIVNVPSSEDSAGLRLALRDDPGETRLAVRRHDAFDSYTALELEHERAFDSRLGLLARLGRHLPATESAALRAAGMKDELALALSYRVSRTDRLGAEWREQRFFGQTGTRFGDGNLWALEYAHLLRTETPDLELGAFVSDSRFGREGTAADAALGTLVPPGDGSQPADAEFFIPDGSRVYGLRASSNLAFRREYTRGLQPFWSLALTQNSTLGAGYDMLLGLAGSILGNDHFQLGVNLNKGGNGSFDRTREFGLSYRLYF